ncbi:hypothetical protein ACVWXU_000561 [Streptomyces sp. TE33382]
MTTPGTRDNPAATTSDTVPPGCLWYTDPDGTLCLAPACMARIQNPDAECLCDTLTARYHRTRRGTARTEEEPAVREHLAAPPALRGRRSPRQGRPSSPTPSTAPAADPSTPHPTPTARRGPPQTSTAHTGSENRCPPPSSTSSPAAPPTSPPTSPHTPSPHRGRPAPRPRRPLGHPRTDPGRPHHTRLVHRRADARRPPPHRHRQPRTQRRRPAPRTRSPRPRPTPHRPQPRLSP